MKQKILLVEDNDLIRENTTELLGFYDFEIVMARNGQEGLDIAIEKKPDLILCDIRMPFMDGYHFLEQIRKEESLTHTRFIFFTASAEKNEIEKGLNMGADDYIIKPFSESELLDKLKRLLA